MTDASKERAREHLRLDRFPRSSADDPAWVVENEMGPNALWLTEFLCEAMELGPGMRVLGCGKALSSVFLAREFGAQVWAADLWISPTENAERVRAASLEDHLLPIRADARDLPFAEAFFDAIISVDAFEYFGMGASYLPSLVRHLKPGRRVGIVNAGVRREFDALPAGWPPDFRAFHTQEWWRHHWSASGCVEVEVADHLAGGRELWLRWNRAIGFTDDAYLASPASEDLGFNRVVARRTA